MHVCVCVNELQHTHTNHVVEVSIGCPCMCECVSQHSYNICRVVVWLWSIHPRHQTQRPVRGCLQLSHPSEREGQHGSMSSKAGGLCISKQPTTNALKHVRPRQAQVKPRSNRGQTQVKPRSNSSWWLVTCHVTLADSAPASMQALSEALSYRAPVPAAC